MKPCRVCKIEKPLSEFHPNPRCSGGHVHQCKQCVKEKSSKYWRENKEAIHARNREWARKNPDKIAAYHKKWATENPEKNAASYKNWAKANPTKVRSISQRRRLREKGNQIFEILPRDMKRLYASPCFYCGKTGKMTADHVIPVSRGGAQSIGNLVPACPSCNFSKHNLFITEWKKRKRA